METNVAELWNKVVNNLSMSTETFNLWIAPLRPLSLENNVFTLIVPNIYFSQWIDENQKDKIESLLTEILGKKTTLL
jgi:chromosomal replication initiator protein